MPFIHSLFPADSSRAARRNSFSSFALRIAAIAALCASAIDAQAACFPIPATASNNAVAAGDGSYAYSGIASAGRLFCGSTPNPSISEFYMPYFTDMSIAGISESAGWTHEIQAANDLFHVGGGVIHFSLASPGAYAPLSYSFNSAFAPISSAALVIATDPDGKSFSNALPLGVEQPFGLTFTMPGSPDAVAGFAAAVPEPSSAAMLAAGLALVGFVASRRKRGSQGDAQSC